MLFRKPTKCSPIMPRALALGLTASLFGCSQNSDKSSTPGGAAKTAKARGTVGVSVMTLGNPFFKVIADSLSEEGKKHGYDVLVTSGDNDVAKQHNQVKDF